jgi:hypothetical protein
MKKPISFLLVLISNFIFSQEKNKVLKLNHQISDLKIERNQERFFDFNLKKDIYYSIVVNQNGIDLVLDLKNQNGKTIEGKDTPNGKFGPEKIIFSPDFSENYSLSVKPLDEKGNSQKGKYSVIIQEIPKKLKTVSFEKLNEDFEILKNAYIETHLGLWYNSYVQFDSICAIQKSKIKDKMNALEFYQIIAPITAFTKEGHSNIQISDEISSYIKQNGSYFPFLVKILDKKVYIVNDFGTLNTKGLMVSKINGESISVILDKFLSIEPADGFNITSKYRWIETAFSKYYMRFIKQTKSFNLELVNPKTNEKVVYRNIPSCNFKDFKILSEKNVSAIPNYSFKDAVTFKIDTVLKTAVLTINSFNPDNYKDGRKGFKVFLENSFKVISEQKIKHLIVDIRKNEGGEQGMEDHLLSYLIDKEYAKYKYVEIPAFTFSFLKYTDDNDLESQKNFEEDLRRDFYQTNDGRLLDIKDHYKGDSPNENNFKGAVYVLINGLTFSGGSEFAALAKNYTNAVFVGEETGGGYYGNTSGNFIHFTLPNSKLTGRIPLYKFVIQERENGIPFGHGVLPDYCIQPTIAEYLNGFDAELEFVKQLIDKDKL